MTTNRNTCCTGRCNQGRACVEMKPMPRIVPCSTLARWFLAWRRFWLG
jgi:hypothetical protein